MNTRISGIELLEQALNMLDIAYKNPPICAEIRKRLAEVASENKGADIQIHNCDFIGTNADGSRPVQYRDGKLSAIHLDGWILVGPSVNSVPPSAWMIDGVAVNGDPVEFVTTKSPEDQAKASPGKHILIASTPLFKRPMIIPGRVDEGDDRSWWRSPYLRAEGYNKCIDDLERLNGVKP